MRDLRSQMYMKCWWLCCICRMVSACVDYCFRFGLSWSRTERGRRGWQSGTCTLMMTRNRNWLKRFTPLWRSATPSTPTLLKCVSLPSSSSSPRTTKKYCYAQATHAHSCVELQMKTVIVTEQTNRLKKWTTRMWANAQRGGRPAEYRWCPLFNATKSVNACMPLTA